MLSLVFRPNLLAEAYWTEDIARRGGGYVEALNPGGGFPSWPDVPTPVPFGLWAPWVGSPTLVCPSSGPLGFNTYLVVATNPALSCRCLFLPRVKIMGAL